MSLGIVVNVSRQRAIDLARTLAKWLEERGVDYVFESLSAEKTGSSRSAPIEKLNTQCDAFISLGGDGTLLFTSQHSVTKTSYRGQCRPAWLPCGVLTRGDAPCRGTVPRWRLFHTHPVTA